MKRANDQVGFLIMVLIWLMSLLPLYGAPLKVGLVKDYARLNDRSFNQLTYQGLVQAEKELGIRGTAVVAKKDSDYLINMQRYARGGYDLVIGVGVFMTEAIKDAAVQFPGTKFLLIDVPVEGFPNISSAIFASQEISFLAGALSALVDRDQSIQLPIRHNGILSIVGGLKIPSVDIYMAGFFQGARYINPDIEVLYGYTGVLGNPVVGKQLALSQHSKGSDIIYQLAGDTGLGVIEASKEANFLSVSSNSDQDSLVLDHVLTSTNKLFNVAVFRTIEETLRDNFPAGLVLYNLENGGLDISRLHKKVPQYISYRLDQIKEDIIDGNIRVGMEIPVWAKHQNQ